MVCIYDTIKAINKAIEDGADILFVERSIFTDKNVFMKTLYTNEKITEIEYKIYTDLFDWFSEKFLQHNYSFVYLQLSTEECYNRIKKRARDAESIIEYNYLDLINKNHDTWLKKYENKNKKYLCVSSDYSKNDTNTINQYFEMIYNQFK